MAGQSRKWMVVVATVWIQALTGTNFDFSAYSSALKEAMGISQVQLNYLATASDLGKAFGWSSGLALLYLPSTPSSSSPPPSASLPTLPSGCSSPTKYPSPTSRVLCLSSGGDQYYMYVLHSVLWWVSVIGDLQGGY
uniref:Nodulin-like domain-containing protein n=1 Tax=Ananas comosus var. bracteatus TaxID=296719 RepID=A0A6V7QY11_ANACO